MAMNPPQGDPQITYEDPMAYMAYLRTRGLNPIQIDDLMRQRFGAGQTPEQRQRQQAAQQQRNALAQTGGLVGGAVLTNEAIRGFPNVKGAFETPKYADSGKITVNRPVPKAEGQVVNGSGEAVDLNAPPIREVGSTTMPDGTPGKLMSDGGKVGDNGKIVNPDGSPGGSVTGQALAGLQVAGGAAQIYSGYKQYQSGEKLGGAANIAGGAYGVAAGTQSLAQGGTAGSLAPYAQGVGTAVAAANIGQQMINEKGSSADRAAKSQYEAQKAALLWIPGYGWAIYAGLTAADALSGGKVSQQAIKLNKARDKFTDRLDFGLGKSLRSKLFHQSTKGVQEMHTGQLLQQSEDPTWQNYVVGMRAQVKEGPKDKEKPFAGKYKTFDEYKKAGLDANDLTGVYGNLDAFKPAYADKAGMPNWAKLTFDQQKAVTQRLIDEDMYSSKKGEVVIKDKEKARRIYEEMSKTNFGVSPGQSSQASPVVATPKKGEVARQSAGLYRNDAGKLVAAPTMREALQKAYNQSKEKK